MDIIPDITNPLAGAGTVGVVLEGGKWQRNRDRGTRTDGSSCRCHALLLRPPCLLKGLIPLIASGCSAFVATQGAPPLQRVLAENMERVLQLEPGPSGKPLPCMLLVGPEGDFTEEEMQELLAAGAKPVGLGPNRLRVETAAIAMVAGAVLQSDSLTFETGEQKEEPIAA
jgi:hypothetical protein